MSKLKLLFFGSVTEENIDTFCSKLTSLQFSAAGPFDAAFLVGKCSQKIVDWNFPIPVYLQHLENAHEIVKSLQPQEAATNNDNEQQSSQVIRIKNNLFLLAASPTQIDEAGIWSLNVTKDKPDLVVVNCPPRMRVDSPACRNLLDNLKHVSYKGCDLLLTAELPQGMERIMSLNDDDESTSYDVASVALLARAKYHVVPSSRFMQSPPFAHLSSTTSTTGSMDHFGRVLTIAPVCSKPPPGKQYKYVHALGLVPLHACSAAELASQKPANLLDNPYTDAAYQMDQRNESNNNNKSKTNNVGLSEASARRILAEERHQQSGMPSQRWEQGKRRRNDDDNGDQGSIVDPNNKTLFLFGLHKDVTGQIQQNSPAGDAIILASLARFDARKVRKPPGAETSSFCFVDFDTHEDAKACWETLGGTVKIHGVDLGIKWATSHKKQKDDASKPSRLTEADAMDSSTIYFKVPGTSDIENIGEAVRKWAEETLENVLADGGEKTVTAQDEPALQVTLRVPQPDVSYGFMDFASHAAASMAVASLTGSTDGGQVLADAKGRPALLQDVVVYLNWSKAKVENENNVIEDESGFKFERKHFPADARQDCWFCLASDSCEKHLITGVFETCYAAMAKGPVHPGHVLLIPVQHSSEGALKNPQVAEEMELLKDRLRQHASDAYDMDLFVFERAIQTKGGYHTHVQCIPIERKLGTRLQTTMQAQAKKICFNLREINSNIGLSAVLTNDDDGESDGYFYAEIPTAGKGFKRFVYKAVSGSRVQVPLQFGREALAAVLGKPELAHWKSCVVDQKQEAELAASFRESLSKEVEG
ncbi:hypothetical protein MPSEU_000463200 [Mayamaea pseudoterrestris]|nr:hypothetical protein MPSEU_000463200 [Mayamaea pseudoterrestris]